MIAAALAVFALVLVGCGTPDMLRAHGSASSEIRTLTIQILVILSFVLVAVWGILAYVVIRGRRRREDQASQTRGNTRIEIIWTAIPAVIVTVLLVLTVRATESIALPDPAAQFTVIGHQWWWEFDFKVDKFKTANEVYVAAGRQVQADLESVDVIHSFWVPQMGGKVDMIPGHVNHIQFVPLREGTYLGECSEFCGVQHGRMRFLFIVVPPDQYSAWVKRQQAPAAAPAGAAAGAGLQTASSVGCGGCHTIRGTSLAGTFGPDLTHFGSRRGIAAFTLRNNPRNLLAWIQDPQGVKPECRMPNVPLPPNQQQNLVTYLEGLK